MQLRPWKYEDILTISEMEKACFPEEPWSFLQLAQSFGSPGFHGVVADEGGYIIGYGGVTVAADTSDIENIAVSENFRRSGIGTAILNSLTRTAHEMGAEKVFLEVRVSNAAAMSMYLKNGFTGIYARTRYYSDGEDCLVMVKNL